MCTNHGALAITKYECQQTLFVTQRNPNPMIHIHWDAKAQLGGLVCAPDERDNCLPLQKVALDFHNKLAGVRIYAHSALYSAIDLHTNGPRHRTQLDTDPMNAA